MTQHSLFDLPVRLPVRDSTPADVVRLETLLERVRCFTRDRGWVTLRQIASACQGSEASVSARLRDLRREGLRVDKRRTDTPGLWEYRVGGTDGE